MKNFILLERFKISSSKRNLRVVQKRPYLLLEVLIALFLLALCAFPLFQPHAYMLKVEKQFIDDIELDRAVDLIFAKLVEDLHNNHGFSWDEIEDKTWKNLQEDHFFHDKNLWKKFQFTGKYQIQSVDSKKKSDQSYLHLLEINLEFFHKKIFSKKKYVYAWNVVVERTMNSAKNQVETNAKTENT